MDEVALALAADAWSRTWRSKAATANAEQTQVSSRRGLVIEVDSRGAEADHWTTVGSTRPARVVDQTLADIAERYGERTAAFVAMQLEYER